MNVCKVLWDPPRKDQRSMTFHPHSPSRSTAELGIDTRSPVSQHGALPTRQHHPACAHTASGWCPFGQGLVANGSWSWWPHRAAIHSPQISKGQLRADVSLSLFLFFHPPFLSLSPAGSVHLSVQSPASDLTCLAPQPLSHPLLVGVGAGAGAEFLPQ